MYFNISWSEADVDEALDYTLTDEQCKNVADMLEAKGAIAHAEDRFMDEFRAHVYACAKELGITKE